jgi:hypothetical protein
MRLLPALLLVAGLASAGDYEGELGFRIWGGSVQPSLFDARVEAYDEDARLRNSQWSGLLNADKLAYGAAAGAEASYGFHPRARAILAFGGGGASVSAHFRGTGSRTYDDPYLGLLYQQMDRLDRYAYAGLEAGITVLLSDFDFCRVGATARAGFHRLSASVERGNDWGPYGRNWWNRDLAGSAPGALFGMEIEAPNLLMAEPFGLGLYALAGYRMLKFRDVEFHYTDSTGVRADGQARSSDGTRYTLDFGGPELSFGVAATIPLTPR